KAVAVHPSVQDTALQPQGVRVKRGCAQGFANQAPEAAEGGEVEPPIQREIAQTQGRRVRHEDEVVHAVELECLSHFARGERRAIREYAVVTTDDVIGI